MMPKDVDFQELRIKIGKGIKIRRIRKGLRQSDMAKKAGLSQTHFSNVENGHVMLSLKKMFEVAELLSCTVDDLLNPDRYLETAKKKS